MKNEQRTLPVTCAVFWLVILTANTASGISIGAGPATIHFDNMFTGYWYAQQIVTVGTAGDDDLVVHITAEGDMAEWLSFEPFTDFNLPAHSHTHFEIIAKIPAGVPVGEYDGMVYVRAEPVECPGGGICFGAGVGLRMSADVVGEATTNSAPSAESAYITPDPAYTDNDLRCVDVNATDPDGQPVQFYYRWFKNAELIASYPFPLLTSDVLSGENFVKGDLITCEITPTDRFANGTPVSASVTISNSPPVVSNVSITPALAYPGEELACQIDVNDVDGDDVTVDYTWYHNGIELPWHEQTITPDVSLGDNMRCEVTPFDGTDYGEAKSDSINVGSPCACEKQIFEDVTLAIDMICPGDGLIIAADNVTVDGNNHTITGMGTGSGIAVAGTNYVEIDNVTIRNCTVENFEKGVELVYSNFATLADNRLISNHVGVYLDNSSQSTLLHNTVEQNDDDGILLRGPGNTVVGNAISSNRNGIYLWGAHDNIITDNSINSNRDSGIYFFGGDDNEITNNDIRLNGKGIVLKHADNNKIHHNNILDNATQATDNRGSNNWYSHDLLEGNYWSDYEGVDDGSGTGKHCFAGDGIGDTLVPHWGDEYPFVGESAWTSTLDSDGDGIINYRDNCPYTPNPEQADTDEDYRGDACDNCANTYNPPQNDIDDDGVGDVCDDSDGDGLVDSGDNCPLVYNPDQNDTDADGFGDACDNCLTDYNPAQDDVDDDGLGDVCDDSDGDGIVDSDDNCWLVYNPDQNDSDALAIEAIEGIISYWTFDDGNGTTVKDSANVNDATVYGATWTIGMLNGALSFEERGAHVRVSEVSSLDFGTRNEITIEAWFKLTGHHDFDGIVSINNGSCTYRLMVTTDLHPFYNPGAHDDQIISSFAFELGRWYHYAMTLQGGGNAIIYVDANEVQNSPAGVPPTLPDGRDILIGTGETPWVHQTEGIIDDVSIYKRALTPEEIQSHYGNGLKGKSLTDTGDGIGDVCDNCPDVYNPSQMDSDGDGIGKACGGDCPNLDGVDPVNVIDFSILAYDWRLAEAGLPGDLNGDGIVDANDLRILAGYWLSDCHE